eukprot:927678-Ditylum_brightwellii.AAC.1
MALFHNHTSSICSVCSSQVCITTKRMEGFSQGRRTSRRGSSDWNVGNGFSGRCHACGGKEDDIVLPIKWWKLPPKKRIIDFITLLAVQITKLPPDEDHPYGHGKFEAIGSLFLDLTLLTTG